MNHMHKRSFAPDVFEIPAGTIEQLDRQLRHNHEMIMCRVPQRPEAAANGREQLLITPANPIAIQSRADPVCDSASPWPRVLDPHKPERLVEALRSNFLAIAMANDPLDRLHVQLIADCSALLLLRRTSASFDGQGSDSEASSLRKKTKLLEALQRGAFAAFAIDNAPEAERLAAEFAKFESALASRALARRRREHIAENQTSESPECVSDDE